MRHERIPIPSPLMGADKGRYFTRPTFEQPPSPLMGEKLGRSAPLMRTPTPPCPVGGEGPAQRLTTKFVPNSIDLLPPRGEGVLTYPCQLDGGGCEWG
jgi:hypothetical protein